MGKDRLAAFSDGVIAILITIMVLELRVPQGADWHALSTVAPAFSTYVLSFIYLAIYWNNHHHLLHTAARVDGLILWANAHLLFWLSLVPAATAWMGENLAAPLPTAVYGAVLLMPAIAYYLLQQAIVRRNGRHSVLAEALGRDVKGKLSPSPLRHGYRARVRLPVGVDRALRAGRTDVAHPRSAHRKRDRQELRQSPEFSRRELNPSRRRPRRAARTGGRRIGCSASWRRSRPGQGAS